MTAPDFSPLLHWVREREAIRLKKDAGAPPPWTEDEILATYRFCNVRREDDRVTVWIREHIREPYADHPNLWFMLAIARWVNWPDTLAELITDGNWPWTLAYDSFPETLGKALQARADRGEKVWTGAYTINAPAKKGMLKTDYVAREVLGQVWRDRADIAAMLDRRDQFARPLPALISGSPPIGPGVTS